MEPSDSDSQPSASSTPMSASVSGEHPGDRTWVILCHLSALMMFAFPLGHLIGPFLIWVIRRDQDPEVKIHGAAALNFQLTLTLIGTLLIGAIVMAVLGIVLLGVGLHATGQMGLREILGAVGGLAGIVAFGLLLAGIGIFNLVMIAINSVRAYDGKNPVYWPVIRFVRG